MIDVRRISFLFLEKLVSHSEEGDGQPRPEEKDEVCRQLVPGWEKVQFPTQGLVDRPVVDGEGQVVSRSGQSVASPPAKYVDRNCNWCHGKVCDRIRPNLTSVSTCWINLATEVLNPLAALSDVEARRESIVLKINNEHFWQSPKYVRALKADNKK